MILKIKTTICTLITQAKVVPVVLACVAQMTVVQTAVAAEQGGVPYNADLVSSINELVDAAEVVDAQTGTFKEVLVTEQLIAQNNPFGGSSNTALPASRKGSDVEYDASGNGITLNFQDAEISALVNLVAKVTGKNFIVDPRVKGKVTLVSGRAVPADTLYDIFLSVLATYNFAAIPSGNLIKILPANLVKTNPTPTITDGNIPNNEQEVTYIVTLDHASVNEILPIIRPLLPATAHIAPHAGSNTLILTDRANNIRRVLSLIERIDQEQQGHEIQIKYLKHADATTVGQVITQLAGTLNSGDAAAGKPVQQTLVQIDEGLNALIIRAPEKDFPILDKLIAQLDVERPGKGNVHVRYLKFAQATDLETLLNGIISDKQADEEDDAAAPSAKISIQADEIGNSLVIRAEEEDYKDITEIIDQLDVRRAQVFIEVIIAEVSESKEAAIGVNWKGALRTPGNQEFTAASGFTDTTGGVQVGFINKYIRGLSGTVVPDLNIILDLLSSDSNSNIISTPNLLTLNNEEAEIVVGQEVPFVTGQFSNSDSTTTGTSGTSTVNPFQTIERKEVGLSLKVTPQINHGGAIMLDIAQEISSVNPTVVSGAADLITDKRTITAKIQVDDGQVIVLGGLIRDDMQDTYERIPVLGDLPLIGGMFRKKTKTAAKTNLMVFLRPRIIRSPADLDNLTRDRYDFLRTQQIESLPETRDLIKDAPPVLPSLTFEGGLQGIREDYETGNKTKLVPHKEDYLDRLDSDN